MKTIYINHSERSPVTNRSQESSLMVVIGVESQQCVTTVVKIFQCPLS